MSLARSNLGWLANTDARSLDRVAQTFGNVILLNSLNSVDEYALVKQAAASLGLTVEAVGFAVTRPTPDSKLTFVTLWVEDANGIDVEVNDGVIKRVRPVPVGLTQRITTALTVLPGVVSAGVGRSAKDGALGVTQIALIAVAALGLGFLLGRRQ